MKTKILITVEGGIVQSVISNNKEIEYVIVDYDLKGDEPVIVGEKTKPEKLKGDNFYELFTDKKDPVEMEVRDSLKRKKF